MEIIIIIALILLNGLFSMSEMSLVSIRKFKLEAEKKKGNSNAKTALELSDEPNKFLSTVQIGITLIGILLGVYSGDKLTSGLTEFLTQYSFIAPYANTIASATIVILITFFSIVFGELLPKRLGLRFPEAIALMVAKPMYWLSKLTSPFVWLLTTTNNAVLKLLGIKDEEETVTEEEIISLIKEGNEGGILEEREHNILKNAFELGDRKVNSLATHRSEIITLDLDDSYEKIKFIIKENKFTTYPVTKDGNIDNIVGIAKMKTLFDIQDDNFQLAEYVKKAVFVSENAYIYPLLETLQNHRSHIAIVIDEFGSTKGLVTLNDILDDLVGDIPDGAEDKDDKEIIRRDENSWLIEGQCSIYEFKKYFKIDIDDDIEKDYVTVSGLFFYEIENVPTIGDRIELGNLVLEVVDKDGNRIDKIMAFRKKVKPL